MKSRVAILAYALLALIVIPIYPHFPSPNELSRWALAAAIVEDHTLEVTKQVQQFGPGFEDLSERNGHLYSNKAPGGALVGLPAFALAHLFTHNIRVTLTAMRLLTATLPAILLALVLARAGGSVITLIFATPLFAYGLLNFSHALTAFCLFTAWWLMREGRPCSQGALLGLAVLAEYPCAIPAAIIFAFAPQKWRVILGGLPFAIVLAVYNALAFGSPFALSSGHERNTAFQSMASSGVFGIGLPNPITLLRLLFDPSKGLFVFSPILLLALFAIPRAYRELERKQFWSLVLVPASMLILYSGYPNWHGGWTVGARYLVPAIPFFCFLIKDEQPILLGWSCVAVIVTTFVFPFVPEDVPLPWGTFSLPILRHALVAPNLFHFIARPLAIVIPFALAFGAVLIATKRRALFALGAAAALATTLIAPSVRVLFERGFVEEVYFERTNTIRMAGPLKARAEAQRALPPPSWPF